MCSPTRAGLLTGRYPMRFGMARSVVHPWSHDGLPPEQLTLAEALGAAGYAHRGIFGKWHLGQLDPKWHPLNNGFTEFKGCYTGAIDYFTHERLGEVDWHDNFDNSDQPGYVTNLIADASAEFITAHANDEPFLCYAAFTAPHGPLAAPQSYLDRYASLDDNPSDGKPSQKQALAADIACLDDGIGRILGSIDRAGIAADTLVVFFSDNGAPTAFAGANAPLRDGKFSVYEGGVRVPAAARWPGHIPSGSKASTPLLNIDLMPTFLSLCGSTQKPKTGSFDGEDISDVLLSGSSGKAKPRDLYFFCGQWGLDKEQIAVTSPDDWKLVVIGPDVRRAGGCEAPGHRVELYRVNVDPLEQHDLAASEPARVKTMEAKLEAFRRSESRHSMPPINHKPTDFHPPAHWHNPPAP
jgi:arylsulfatase A-like enzyme